MKRKLQFFLAALVFIFAFIFLANEILEARAGGGHRYSGGSSRSSSGGYSGSSGNRSSRSRPGGYNSYDNEAPPDPYILMFVFGLIIVILLAHFILRFIEGKRYEAEIIKLGNVAKNRVPPTNNLLLDLKKRDIGFDEKRFIERIRLAFTKIQMAWEDRNIELAQAFISDGVYEQFSILIDEMKSEGIIDRMDDLKVKAVFPIKYSQDKNFEVMHLKITASAINYREDDKTNKFLEGDRRPIEFTEIWSFLRKAGAKSNNQPGLIEGQCPNCGTPIKIGRLAKCDSCNSFLRSGEHDWVLSEITQLCEWTNPSPKIVPGLVAIGEEDHGFNMQHLEDRVSVVFWRKNQAERLGNVASLRKVAQDQYCKKFAEILKPDERGNRRIFCKCAIGAVDLMGIEMTSTFNMAFVKVTWSGTLSTVSNEGKISISGSPKNQDEVFVLVRKSGVNTEVGASLNSSHCPACGAPEQSSLENSCTYCGEVINDGSKDWVLCQILSYRDKRITEIRNKLKTLSISSKPGVENAEPANPSIESSNQMGMKQTTDISATGILQWSVAMMMADGKIDDKELELIKAIASRGGIPEARISGMINDYKDNPVSINEMLNDEDSIDKNVLLKELTRVALIDGEVSVEEEKILREIGKEVGMMPYDLKVFIKQERKQMFLEAREALKNSKN